MTVLVAQLVATTMDYWAGHLPFGLRVLLLVFSAAWLALLAHELGHAGMARLLGVRVWSITLGRGPVLWQGVLDETRIRVAILPLHGEVRLYDPDAEALGYREAASGGGRFEWRSGSWRAPLISMAGTLGNLLAAKMVAGVLATGPHPRSTLFLWTTAAFLINALMLLNLMPLRGFDGWRIAIQAAAWRHRQAGAAA